jgi:hypothetical protein
MGAGRDGIKGCLEVTEPPKPGAQPVAPGYRAVTARQDIRPRPAQTMLPPTPFSKVPNAKIRTVSFSTEYCSGFIKHSN